MDQFEAYFQRADLDRDGRISGAEAVSFLQASNLSRPVLAQIWNYADRNKAGFLGRQEFYNALKLVTVAQSKRDLTPDIVKAALHGPASAKIPAPQINLAALPGPQSNIRSTPPVPGSTNVPPVPPQSTSIQRPQGFSSQQSQFTRPPRPPPASATLQSPQVVASQGMPQGGSTSAPRPLSSSLIGGRTSSSQLGNASQLTDRVVGPTVGLAASGPAPSTQPRSLSTMLSMQPVSPNPMDTTSNHASASQDSKALAVTGDGVSSDSVFGDVFSVTSSQVKQDLVGRAPSPSSLPVSAATVMTSSGPQPAVKPGLFNPSQGSFSQHQQSQLKVNLDEHMQTSNAFPVGSGNSVSSQSQLHWPKMTQSDVQKYSKVFFQVDTDRDGKITGEQARNLFLSWRLPREILKQVWDLSDQDNDSMLSLREFCVALYLMERSREGRPLPSVLPTSVILDETMLPSSGPPAMPYGNASWRPTGFQQPQVTKVARPETSFSGGRPPRPPQLEESSSSSKPKPKVPVLEKHFLEQLSTEEQNALNSKFQEATDAEKKVAELEKEIMDAKEKIQFYHAKMQELVLYKSRCDNRLNEIAQRVSADKQEAELLAKNYEEKYKQAGDVASKLTIEEATFQDIQDKKMELYRAIVKLDQEGNVDKFRELANHIQLDLEGLLKSLNERCKTYGLRGKPTSLVELPFGWQVGIQEGAADWDEDWDKFEDEGFQFVKEITLDVQNVIAPPKPKTSIRDKASTIDDSKVKESSLNDDIVAGKTADADKRILEDEGVSALGEEQRAGSPSYSPTKSNPVESPSKAFRDSPLSRDVGFDDSPRKSQSEHKGATSVPTGNKAFDEPGWGAFDTQLDADIAWDFNSTSTKDEDLGRHGENSFFSSDNWNLNPVKTGTTRDNTYLKQSPFFDSVPSTPNTYVKQGPFFDSVPSTPNTYVRQGSFFDSVPSTPNAYAKQGSFFDSVPSTPNAYAKRGSLFDSVPSTPNTFVKQSPFLDSVPSTPLYSSSTSPRADNTFQRTSPFSFADSVPSTPMYNSGNSPRRFSEGSLEHSFDTFSRFDSFNIHDSGHLAPGESFSRFDSFRSTRDSDYDPGLFSTSDSLARFDSFRSTADSEYNPGVFPQRKSFTRFDSVRSTKDSDLGHGFSSFDDADPFGSSEPFKSSQEGQVPMKDSDSWKAF